MAESPKTLKVGRILADRYEVLSRLGEGGFSAVFKAKQLSSGKLVAVKVLRPERLEDAKVARIESARFDREMKLVASLKHPHIVPLLDSGKLDDDRQFIVLEFIEGDTLNTIIKTDGPLEPREAKRLMVEVLEAIAAAHSMGIVHRDLKPQNIMLIKAGTRRNAMVLDFGVSGVMEAVRGDDYTKLTASGQVPGTPAYMAPEQIRTDVLDPQSDLYAWGLVFLEVLTGVKAFASTSMAKTITMQLSPDPVPIPESLRAHPLGLLIRQAVAKDTSIRFKTAADIMTKLEEIDIDRDLGLALQREYEARLRSEVSLEEAQPLAEGAFDIELPNSGPHDATVAAEPLELAKKEAASNSRPPTRLKGERGPLHTALWPIVAGIVLASAAIVYLLLSSSEPAAVRADSEQAEAPPETPGPEPQDPTLPSEPGAGPADDCEGGTPADCVQVAAFLEAEGSDAQVEKAGILYQEACDEGEGAGCVGLGRRFEAGKGVARSLERAADLYEQGCNTGVPAGCSALGLLVEEGTGRKKDLSAAAILFSKACERDDPEGCGELGRFAQRGRGDIAFDMPRAVQLMQRACDGGHARSCSRLGTILQEGDGVAADPTRGVKLLERACDLGYSRGCSKAAYTYQRGIGVARNSSKTAELYVRSCEFGLAQGCSSACYLYQIGEGVPVDRALAYTQCTRACLLDDAKGCYRLGTFLRNGIGVTPNPVKAAEAFSKACKGGESKACRQ